MDYWESIVQEVLHRDDENYKFRFTDIGRSILRERTRKQRQCPPKQEATLNTTYFLGKRFKGVYFTKREAETMYYLLQGKTIPGVGKALNLSARTIEFYVKNMKLKIGAKTKYDLVEVIRETDFMAQLHFIAAMFENEAY